MTVMRLATVCVALTFSFQALGATADRGFPQGTGTGEPRPATQPAGGDGKVTAFIEASRAVFGMGEAAKKVIDEKAKAESTATGNIAGAVGDIAKSRPAPATPPEAKAVDSAVTTLITATKELLALRDKGLGPIAAAAGDAANADVADVLKRVEARVYLTLCMNEVRVAATKGGNYPGMFSMLDKYNREKIADAFFDIYKNPALSAQQRKMAAEGVAQLGDKKQAEALKALYADKATKPDVKLLSATILVRLGSRDLFDQEIKPALDQLAKTMDEGKKLADELKAADTDEKKQAVAKKDGELRNRAIELHSALAQSYQDAWLREDTVKHFEQMIAILGTAKVDPRMQQALGTTYYNLACAYAQLKKTDEAIDRLDKAFQSGYRNLAWVREDLDLVNIKNDPRLEALLKKYAANDVKPGAGEKP